MEHAELLSNAFKDMKAMVLGFDNLSTWLKLVLIILIPALIGIVIASMFMQYIIRPILVPILVESESYGFTYDGLTYMLGWLAIPLGLLFVFLFPLFQGYLYRVIRSDAKPSTKNLFGLFFSGWRVNIVCLFYAIPMIIIYTIYALLYFYISGKLSGFMAVAAAGDTMVDTAVFIVFLVLQFITFIIVMLFGVISLVHVARGASYKEAFNLSKTLTVIRQIGWYNYILCIVTCTIMVLLISILFLGIGMGFEGAFAVNVIILVIYLILLVPIALICARYLTRVYDVGTKPELEEAFDDFDNF